jgi:radical SAM superfamily enzyme YgiQ (UPF0313 family)
VKDITIANICFGARDSEGKVGYVPLGPLYVTAALEARGYGVDFRDYLVGSSAFAEPMAPQSLVSFLDDSCPIVGIGCTSGTLPFVISSLSRLKAQQPEKIFILGGIGPTGVAEEILQHFPFIDVVVRGEGEATVVELVGRLMSGREPADVEGIVYRHGDRVRVNPDRTWIEDLDEVPFPAYHQVNPHRYSIKGIASSRGCPYQCVFCDTAPFWGRRCRSRGVKNVIREMVHLRDTYGIREFEFVDDTFVLNRQRVFEFCERLKQEKPEMKWTCCGRVDLMDEELLKTMAEAGCSMIFYGMESGSDKVLKRIKKRFTREQARAVIAQTARYFDIYVSFIWGFPFETMADFRETIDCTAFVEDLGGTPWLFSLAPLPLSSLYREYRHTLVLSDGWFVNMAGPDRQKMVELVDKYPGIFSGFYRYPTEGFEEKYRFIKERGLMEHGAQTVFLDGLLASKWE